MSSKVPSILTLSYAIVSAQTKGQPKYVRMRGQTVDEVSTKTQYTSAETGGDLDAADITSAYQFGDEAKVPNVLELNWWETDLFLAEQEQLATELLRVAGTKVKTGGANSMDVDGAGAGAAAAVPHDKVSVRTRVQLSDKEREEIRTMGISPQIKIIGFQSPDNLLLQDNVKHSYFIYPDETVSGCCVYFR